MPTTPNKIYRYYGGTVGPAGDGWLPLFDFSDYLPVTGGTLSGTLTSTVATGTAPISVASTTVCPNLNADMLDGLHASAITSRLDVLESSANEVWIGPGTPPSATAELWYDTDEPDVITPVPGWFSLTFQNGWSDYAQGFQTASYRKIGDIVYVRGLIKRAAGDLNGAAVGNLPLGYRPPLNQIFFGASFGTSGFGTRIDINANGDLVVAAGGQASTGYSTHLSIDGIVFSVTA